MTIHEDVSTNRTTTAWPDIIPSSCCARLRSRTGLRDRLIKYTEAFKALPPDKQRSARLSLVSQNRIRKLLNAQCEANSIADHEDSYCNAVKELFKFSFGLLTSLSIRDQQYKDIYEATEHHVCPFCGLDHFDDPSAPRHDLDHYLAKSRYPFAAVNLLNLVPMCHRCNSSYKATDDVLYREGTRRPAFDPYSDVSVTVSLLNSVPNDGTTAEPPTWQVDFTPDLPQSETWDDVFSIRKRYVRDHLNAHYFYWLDEFVKVCTSLGSDLESDQGLLEALKQYVAIKKHSGLRDREFLKAAVFEFLHKQCDIGNQQTISQIRNFSND